MRRRFFNSVDKVLGGIKYMYFESNTPEDKYDPSRAESFLGLVLPYELTFGLNKYYVVFDPYNLSTMLNKYPNPPSVEESCFFTDYSDLNLNIDLGDYEVRDPFIYGEDKADIERTMMLEYFISVACYEKYSGYRLPSLYPSNAYNPYVLSYMLDDNIRAILGAEAQNPTMNFYVSPGSVFIWRWIFDNIYDSLYDVIMELGGDPIDIGKEYMTSNYMLNGPDALHYVVCYNDTIDYHLSDIGIDFPVRFFYFVKKV